MAAERIEPAEIERIATLARLTLAPAEVQALTADLGEILGYVRTLAALDTADVAPTAHAVELPTLLRPDEVRPGLGVEPGLADAPERLADGFGVPKIIE